MTPTLPDAVRETSAEVLGRRYENKYDLNQSRGEGL
jgi:hypothetical protein